MIHRIVAVALGSASCCLLSAVQAEIPADYRGKPFADAVHKTGMPVIPGIVQCALYDLGGEGDTDPINNGSGKLAPDDFVWVSWRDFDRPAARAWARSPPPGSFIRRAVRW